jgi:DNA-directed RNA polymerase subunit omega
MLTPSIDELLEIVPDRYSLVITASMRAKQIIESETYRNMEIVDKAVTIAAKEIINGKVRCMNCE